MKNITTLLSLFVIMLLGAGVPTDAVAQSESADKPTIVITEYSDYQCPACAYFHPMVKKLKEKFGDQIQLELRHFPLNSHQYAALAARAAESAKNQGKFREMHSLIFENQNRWSRSGNPVPVFVGFAKKLNLDVEQFRDDLNSAETQKKVMEEKREGVNRGVNSTPTFFIDGNELSQLPRTYQQFEEVVQKHLNEKKNG